MSAPASPVTVGHVVAVLRWLAVELQRERHPLAHVPNQLAMRLVDGGPADGCKTCGGPVERVRTGRPRLHCEGCRRPRRQSPTKVQSGDMTTIEIEAA